MAEAGCASFAVFLYAALAAAFAHAFQPISGATLASYLMCFPDTLANEKKRPPPRREAGQEFLPPWGRLLMTF